MCVTWTLDIQAVGRCQQHGWHDDNGDDDGDDGNNDDHFVLDLDIQAVREGSCQQQECMRSTMEKVYHEILCQEFSKPRCSMNV